MFVSGSCVKVMLSFWVGKIFLSFSTSRIWWQRFHNWSAIVFTFTSFGDLFNVVERKTNRVGIVVASIVHFCFVFRHHFQHVTRFIILEVEYKKWNKTIKREYNSILFIYQNSCFLDVEISEEYSKYIILKDYTRYYIHR